MSFPRLSIALGLAIAAALQIAVLGWMVLDRTRLIKTGREVVLPIKPVDPRDLFRGQYVRLGYDISGMSVKLLEGPRPARNAPFYVTIEQTDDGAWRPVRISVAKPQAASAKQVVLKARPFHAFPTSDEGFVSVRYGIESYFVPEGEGPRLEELARNKKLAILIAVDGSGAAAIKGILIDGKLQYTEQLL